MGVQRFSDWLFTPKVDWYTGIPVYRDFLTAYSISASIPVYWYTIYKDFLTPYSIFDGIQVYRYTGIQRFSDYLFNF